MFIVLSIQPKFTYLQNCIVSGLHNNITIECMYNNSLATGFQAYLTSNFSQKLYVVEATNTTTVTVVVEETGEYWITVLPLRGEMGVLYSNVEYAAGVIVPIPEGISK